MVILFKVMTTGNSSDDLVFLRRAQAGDNAAFDQLWQHHRPGLARFCRSLYRKARVDIAFDADDLVSETFIRALHQLSRYDPLRGNFDSWLRELARNLFLNRYTRQQRHIRLLAAPPNPSLAQAESPWNHTLLRAGMQAVNALPLPLRAVFHLHLEEFSHQEIALQLNVTTATASKRLERARYQLRQTLALLLDDLPLLEIELSAIIRGFQVIELTLETGGVLQVCSSAPASNTPLASRRGWRSWLQRGEQLYRAGQWEAATEELTALLRQYPMTLEAVRVLVHIFREQDRLAELTPQLPATLPETTPPAVAAELRGYAALARGEGAAACDAFRQAIRLAPEDPQPYFALDHALESQSRYEEQLTNLAALRQILPHDSRAYVASVFPYAQLGRDDEALPLLEQAVALDPNSPQAIKELFQVRMRLRRHDHVTESLARRLVYLAPDLLDSWHSLAWFWRVQGHPASSVAVLQRFVREHPNHAMAHAALAWEHLYASNHEKATSHARRAYALAPRRSYVAWTMAMACGCFPEWISSTEVHLLLTEIARQFPRDSFLQREVALRFQSRGWLKEALRYARRAWRLYPGPAEAALLQSIYRELGHAGRQLKAPVTDRPSD